MVSSRSCALIPISYVAPVWINNSQDDPDTDLGAFTHSGLV